MAYKNLIEESQAPDFTIRSVPRYMWGGMPACLVDGGRKCRWFHCERCDFLGEKTEWITVDTHHGHPMPLPDCPVWSGYETEIYNCPTCGRKLEIDYVLRHGSTAGIQYEAYCNPCRIKWAGNWSDNHQSAKLSLWCNMRNVCDEIKKRGA